MTDSEVSLPSAGGRDSKLDKISVPALVDAYPRVRLFKLLDQARKHPIIWLFAPAGSGKTTLIASYLRSRKLAAIWYQMDAGDNDIGSFFYHMGLAAQATAPAESVRLPLFTPEYAAGLPLFAANYFRKFFACLKTPGLVVLDNYQDVKSTERMQEVLQHGLNEVPAGLSVVVLSREAVPRALARARASGRIASLGWEELKFTEQETAALVRKNYRTQSFDRTAVDNLYRVTQGWAAGVVLLSEHAKRNPAARQQFEAATNQPITEYFAKLFELGEPHVRRFLLKTAFLPKIAVTVAHELTGEKDTTAILKYLTRRNLFTLQLTDESFEYHPLFRAFLVDRVAHDLSDAAVTELKIRSAELLSAHGDIAAAIELLQQASNEPAAIRLIEQNAVALVSQGRTQTLEGWIRAIPQSLRESNPWILYWLGVCRLMFAPAESRRYFEQAYALFENATDATPLCLAWSGIVNSYILEFNDFRPMRRWLELYPTLAQGRVPPNSKAQSDCLFAYVSGLRLGCTDHPELVAHMQQATALFESLPYAKRQLSHATTLTLYHLWVGDIAKMVQMIEGVAVFGNLSEVAPMSRLYWYLCKAIHQGGTGDPEACLSAVTDGLGLADAAGIHVLDAQLLTYGVFGQLTAFNVEGARGLLDRLSQSIGGSNCNESIYRSNASMVLLHEGQSVRALEEGGRALQLARSSDFYIGEMNALLCVAYAYARHGETDLGLQAATDVSAMAERMRSKLFGCFASFALANIHRIRASREPAVAALDKALSIMSEMGTATPGWCPAEDAAMLYDMALQEGLHTVYVRKLIAKANLRPPRAAMSDNWSWQVRIHTLGRFAVVRHDIPLAFTGKAQRKPLDLLRVLVAFRGRHVSVNRIMQTLWPDADEEKARVALRTTLHRLRRLLGDQSIVSQGNHMSINADCCWLDTWAFERLHTEVSAAPGAALTRRLLDIYCGAFLADEDQPYIVAERERLRICFVRAVIFTGQALDALSNPGDAIRVYQRGIEAEPLVEELYRALMQLYRRLNRIAEAASVYRRCQAALRAALDVEPSPETTALLIDIQS